MGCFSTFANTVTLIGIPTLCVAYYKIWRQLKNLRMLKSVSEDCLEFATPATPKCAINLVPLDGLACLPRQGEFVKLPGEGTQYGSGLYRVESLEYVFLAQPRGNRPAEAELKKVIAKVSKC